MTKKKFISELNQEVTFLIWDTAGQEYYDSITKRYYRGADAAVIVFSITDRNSYIKIPYWYEKVITECGKIPVLLALNKIDIEKGREVTLKEAYTFAHSMNLELIETSCKNNIRVRELFEKLASMFVKENCILEEDEEYEESQQSTIKSQGESIKEEVFGKDGNIRSFKLKIIKYENKNSDGNAKNTKRINKKCC